MNLCLPTGAGLAFDKDAARKSPSACVVFNFLSLLQHSFIHPPHPPWDKPWTLEGNSEVSLWPRRHTFILLLTSEAIAVKMGKMTTSHTVEHILSFFCFLCVVICLGVASIPKYYLMWTNTCDLTENSKIRRTRSGAGKENERRPQVSWPQFYKPRILETFSNWQHFAQSLMRLTLLEGWRGRVLTSP